MKKNSMLMAAALVATGVMVSCEAPKTVTTVEEHYSQARVLDVQTKADIKTVQGELKVNPVRVEDQWIFSR